MFFSKQNCSCEKFNSNDTKNDTVKTQAQKYNYLRRKKSEKRHVEKHQLYSNHGGIFQSISSTTHLFF